MSKNIYEKIGKYIYVYSFIYAIIVSYIQIRVLYLIFHSFANLDWVFRWTKLL